MSQNRITFCDTRNMEQNNEKKMTKYDRKLQAKAEAAKRERKKQIITVTVGSAIVLCIIALLILVPLSRRRQDLKEYIRIGDTSVSRLEFNYYKTNVANTYSQYLSLFGVDASVPLELQMYDEELGLTWADFFDQEAAAAIQTTKVLVADAKTKGLKFDVADDYKTFLEGMKSAAKAAGQDYDDFLVSMYGVSASEKTLKPLIQNELIAAAYSKQLTTDMTPTDEEVQAKYDENPDDYDSVDYRVLDFPAGVTEESTEEEIKAAMEASTKSAQEMLDKVNAGEDFETLCATYAREDLRDEFADTETDRSLTTGVTSSMAPSSYGEWLFDDRKEGETTLFTDEENRVCYVIKFEKRYMGENVLENIKSNMASEAVSEYTTSLAENFPVEDPNGYLNFLHAGHSHEEDSHSHE